MIVDEEQDQWKPPDYAIPEEESQDEWQPPEYAVLEEEKKPKSLFSKAVDFLKPPDKLDVTKALPAQLHQFADEHPNIKEFVKGVMAIPRSTYETVNEIGKRGAEQLNLGANHSAVRDRDIHGAFETVTSPLMGPINTVNRNLAQKAIGQDIQLPGQGEAAEEGLSQLLGAVGLPGKEMIEAYDQGNYAKLAGMGLSAAMIAGLGKYIHGELGKSPAKSTSTETEVLPVRRPKPTRLGLPSGPRFVSGEAGVAEVGKTYPRDTAEPYNVQQPQGGTVTPADIGEVNQVTPELAAKYGLRPGSKIIDVTPENKAAFAEEVKAAQEAQTQQSGEKPLPTRSPNLDPSRFNIGVEPEKPPVTKTNEDRIYDIAREKFKMAQDMPESERSSSVKPNFINPFEKKESGEWQPPDYAKPENEPQFARTDTGKIKIGQNIQRSAAEVTTGYSRPLPAIMAREGLQNAFDAVKSMGDKGHVAISINDKGIDIHDNGKGMTADQLATVFSDLYESGKVSDENATGGKGIGKASYMLGGKYFKVETIAVDGLKKIKTTMEGTPEQLMEGVEPKQEEVPFKTPTGTKIHTEFKDDQESYNARDMVKKIVANTRGLKTKISTDLYGSNRRVYGDEWYHDKNLAKYNKEDIMKSLNEGNTDKIIGQKNIMGNDVTIRIPENEKSETRSGIDVQYLNNGMHQFDRWHYMDKETPNMPANVIVDIKPSAAEGSEKYPFPTQRESIKDDLHDAIKDYIDQVLVHPEQGKRKNTLKELYASMADASTKLQKGKDTFRTPIFLDPGSRLKSNELREFQNSQRYNQLVVAADFHIENVLSKLGGSRHKYLEGVGTVLDPGMYGVHIPNPDAKNSSILINFLQHVADSDNPKDAAYNAMVTIQHEIAHIPTEMGNTPLSISLDDKSLSDPRVGKYLESYLKEVKAHGGLNMGHGMQFVHNLGEVMSKTPVREAFETADDFHNILTDESGQYHPEIQKLLQIYKDSRGRPEVTTDYLSPTGDKSKTPKGGKSNTGGNPPSDGDRVVRSAISKLFSGLEEARSSVNEQEEINRSERSRRFAAFNSVRQPGAAGAAKSLSKLKGEYEKVPGTQLGLNEKEADSLFTAVKFANITPGEKARGYTALFKLLNGESLPTRSDLAVLDNVFGGNFGDKIIEMHGGIGGVGIKLAKAANTMKSLQNSISLAAPLRHGIGLIARREFGPAFVDMFKFFANKEYYDQSMKALEERPNYLLGRESGLFTSKPESLMNSEEQFLNSYVGNIPRWTGIPQMVAASSRAYSGFLNKLRADVFDSMVRQAKALGHDVGGEDYVRNNKGEIKTNEDGSLMKEVKSSKNTEAIAKFINNATGRGSLGSLNKITNELNMAFWSPRMISSRINMLANPKIYIDLPKGMRLEGLKSLLGIAALGTTVDVLAAYGGAKISNNILSTDYGKSRFGKDVIDPWGGFQQYIVGAARFLAGKTDNPQPTNRLQIAGQFLANKESPAASLAHVILTSKPTRGGNPGDITTQYGQQTSVQREVAQRFTPIFIQDLKELAEANPKWSEDIGLTSALGLASLAGMSQEYPERRQQRLRFSRSLKSK